MATIPSTVRVQGVTVRDGVCYVDFDSTFLEDTANVTDAIVIYSIVNSVIDGGNVSEVQISINGDSSIVYQESIKLDEPLSRNQEMIKED